VIFKVTGYEKTDSKVRISGHEGLARKEWAGFHGFCFEGGMFKAERS